MCASNQFKIKNTIFVTNETNEIMRSYYQNTIQQFLDDSFKDIWADLTSVGRGDLLNTQKEAWKEQIGILKEQLKGFRGNVYFEYSIPRMGKRIDTVVLIDGVVFVIEFKVGCREYLEADMNQVWDYALDLKYFHEASHDLPIIPILVATGAKDVGCVSVELDRDQVVRPLKSGGDNLGHLIHQLLGIVDRCELDSVMWSRSRYAPTPTIIEAAQALYNNHSVEEISRSEAENLGDTSDYIFGVIERARDERKKVICFVTGVPGAGKTLVGLNISTQSMARENVNAVYLSGNGPLVKILVEALTRDKVRQLKEAGDRRTKKEVEQEVKSFIQNVHHFRDACLEGTRIEAGEIVADEEYFQTKANRDKSFAPIEHVAIYDEAQRAWNWEMTANFMKQKKNRPDFPYSEPHFLLSSLDRHEDWALFICLIGGGQEINTGEAGIKGWIDTLNADFKHWQVHISSRLTDKEYAEGVSLDLLSEHPNVVRTDRLHLAVSLRSFRAEKLSLFVQQLLDKDRVAARDTLAELDKYPIVITRSVDLAKRWLKKQARGNERYGMIVSSQAYRLRPLAIDVRFKPDPVHWFLADRSDIRSSYYLEDVVTEFDIQGLELDYTCVVWDGDFRCEGDHWGTYSFRGNKWVRINKEERKMYLKNAYRVLLTRARQGMVIVVPEGDAEDITRKPEFYDASYAYLKGLGMKVLRNEDV